MVSQVSHNWKIELSSIYLMKLQWIHLKIYLLDVRENLKISLFFAGNRLFETFSLLAITHLQESKFPPRSLFQHLNNR